MYEYETSEVRPRRIRPQPSVVENTEQNGVTEDKNKEEEEIQASDTNKEVKKETSENSSESGEKKETTIEEPTVNGEQEIKEDTPKGNNINFV